LAFHETLLRRFKAASGVDADIDNYRTPFMCSTMVSVTTTGQRSTPVIAQWQHHNVLMLLVTIWLYGGGKMRWFKLFCRRRSFVIELSKPLLAP
jgi:hypothetical protein